MQSFHFLDARFHAAGRHCGLVFASSGDGHFCLECASALFADGTRGGDGCDELRRGAVFEVVALLDAAPPLPTAAALSRSSLPRSFSELPSKVLERGVELAAQLLCSDSASPSGSGSPLLGLAAQERVKVLASSLVRLASLPISPRCRGHVVAQVCVAATAAAESSCLFRASTFLVAAVTAEEVGSSREREEGQQRHEKGGASFSRNSSTSAPCSVRPSSSSPARQRRRRRQPQWRWREWRLPSRHALFRNHNSPRRQPRRRRHADQY